MCLITPISNQFCVFSPAFMFSLSPNNNNTKLSQSNNSNQSNTAPIVLPKNSTSSQVSLQIASVYERHIKLLAKVLQTLANIIIIIRLKTNEVYRRQQT